MNSTAAQQQTAQTAQNVLSEERSFQSVQYAITGCREADTIAGIIAVLNTTGLNVHSLRGCQRVLEYLAALYKDSADTSDRYSDQWKTQQSFSSGSLGGASQQGLGAFSQVNPIPNSPPPYPTASQIEQIKNALELQRQQEGWKKLSELPDPKVFNDEIWKIKP